jgi:hypothetical protein
MPNSPSYEYKTFELPNPDQPNRGARWMNLIRDEVQDGWRVITVDGAITYLEREVPTERNGRVYFQ